jgi:hypothetical protein
VNARAWIAGVALAVALPGVLRDASVVFWKAGPLVTTRAGGRFEGLSFPAGERAGFVTDVEAGSEATSARYYQALYALAPRALQLGAGPRLVVADVEDAASIERICAANRLHVVQRPSPKVALLERNR